MNLRFARLLINAQPKRLIALGRAWRDSHQGAKEASQRHANEESDHHRPPHRWHLAPAGLTGQAEDVEAGHVLS